MNLLLIIASCDAFVSQTASIRNTNNISSTRHPAAEVHSRDASRTALTMSATASSVTSASAASDSPKANKEGVVIVGAGPSGLATALMLAKRGWTGISVIEKTPSAGYFDPNVAFV